LFGALPVLAQDASGHALRELARDASRRGWIDLRSIGSVVELNYQNQVLGAVPRDSFGTGY
jgi:hypothetical protein